jgi:5-methylcytosine-specific restriction endonuclease McrBC regulatory subunit McrC
MIDFLPMLIFCQVGKQMTTYRLYKIAKIMLNIDWTPQGIFTLEVYVLLFKISMVWENFRWMVLAEFSHFH